MNAISHNLSFQKYVSNSIWIFLFKKSDHIEYIADEKDHHIQYKTIKGFLKSRGLHIKVHKILSQEVRKLSPNLQESISWESFKEYMNVPTGIFQILFNLI